MKILQIILLSSCMALKPESNALIMDSYIERETRFIKVKKKLTDNVQYSILVNRYSGNGELMHNTKRTCMIFVDPEFFNYLESDKIYSADLF